MSTNTLTAGHPLEDVILLEGKCRCLLVTDTVETDGRFILCHLAAKHSSPVFWLACGTGGEASTVLSAIRRLGTSESAKEISVKSIPKFLEETCLNGDFEHDVLSWEHILAMIREWIPTVSEGHPLVIVDDISTLSALIGEREAYLLVYWARDLSFELDFSLVIRSFGTDETSFHAPIDFFGVGGATNERAEVSYESGLAELADQVVDVRPLASGYSRDAQGRFFVTDSLRCQKLYNYLLLDNDIRVFRKHQ